MNRKLQQKIQPLPRNLHPSSSRPVRKVIDPRKGRISATLKLTEVAAIGVVTLAARDGLALNDWISLEITKALATRFKSDPESWGALTTILQAQKVPYIEQVAEPKTAS